MQRDFWATCLHNLLNKVRKLNILLIKLPKNGISKFAHLFQILTAQTSKWNTKMDKKAEYIARPISHIMHQTKFSIYFNYFDEKYIIKKYME